MMIYIYVIKITCDLIGRAVEYNFRTPYQVGIESLLGRESTTNGQYSLYRISPFRPRSQKDTPAKYMG